MDNANKKPDSDSKNDKQEGKDAAEKPLTPAQIRYFKMLAKIEAMNLPPMDLDAIDKKVRELEGY